MEKLQLQALEMEHKKLCARLEEERGKNKHVVLMLVKECKQLSSKLAEEAQRLEEAVAQFEEEKKKARALEESLAGEKRRSAQMEAQMEKQLSELDTDREQLHARLSREEAHATDLREERERMRRAMEQLSKERDARLHRSLPRRSKERGFASVSTETEGPILRTLSCQTDAVLMDSGNESVRKLPLTVPMKPSTIHPLLSGHAKANVSSNAAFGKPIIDRHSSCGDLLLSPGTSSLSHSQMRMEENGPSDLTSLPSPFPDHVAFSPAPSIAPQGSPVPSPYSPSVSAPGHQGLNPRVQAARFRFQSNANDPDQNGNTTQSPTSRDASPTSRDNLMAKQLARNTVTQVLSRFTSPQGVAPGRPGMSHSMDVGTYPPPVSRMSLKAPSVSRIDRGNPPPIPPKKPGLSQTPSLPHPQLKAIMDSGRSPNAKTEGKLLVSSSSSCPPQGIRVANEEVMSRSSPQLPPKPALDLSVASSGCALPSMDMPQVGAWPSPSPGLSQPACPGSSFVIPTTIACSINPLSAPSRRPRGSDSLLVTASGKG